MLFKSALLDHKRCRWCRKWESLLGDDHGPECLVFRPVRRAAMDAEDWWEWGALTPRVWLVVLPDLGVTRRTESA